MTPPTAPTAAAYHLCACGSNVLTAEETCLACAPTAAEVGMNIRKCEQCGRLSAPAGNPCAYCGAIATAAEREGEGPEELPSGGFYGGQRVVELRAALLAARRENAVAPLPTEILAIRAARDFCADHAMSGMAVTLIDQYIARCRAALAATPEGRSHA